jgi:HEAT repeat protein
MLRTWLAVLVVLVVALGLWYTLFERPSIRPPEHPGDESGDSPFRTALESPFPLEDLPPATPAAPAPPPSETAPIGSADAENAGVLALERVGLDRAGRALRGTLDIRAFVSGEKTVPEALLEVPGPMIEKLFGLLTTADPDRKLRVALAMAAVRLRPEEIERLRNLLEVEFSGMKDAKSKNVVFGLAFALSAQGDSRGAERLADALRTGEGSEVKDFRNGAALMLAIVEEEATSPLLRELLASDPDRMVRKHSAIGLGAIGGEENAEALALALVEEQDIEVRAWSALARGRSANSGEGAGDETLYNSLASDPAGEVRAAAAYAYAQTGGSEVVETLVRNWYQEDHELARVGLAAGAALKNAPGGFLDAEAGPWLVHAVQESESSTVRFYAAMTLGLLPGTEARGQALRSTILDDRSEWVRMGAVDALVTAEGAGARSFIETRLAAETSDRMKAHLTGVLKKLPGE